MKAIGIYATREDDDAKADAAIELMKKPPAPTAAAALRAAAARHLFRFAYNRHAAHSCLRLSRRRRGTDVLDF